MNPGGICISQGAAFRKTERREKQGMKEKEMGRGRKLEARLTDSHFFDVSQCKGKTTMIILEE